MKEHAMSKRAVVFWFIFVVVLFCTAVVFFFGYHARGKTVGKIALSLKQAEANRVTAVKALEDCKKSPKKRKKPVTKRQVAKPPITAKKKVPPVAKQAAPPLLAAAPAPALLPVIPRAAAETGRLTLRINVVEWSQVFEDRSLVPRDIGPIIRQGLAAGTVRRAVAPLTFNVNGAEVLVQNGQAVLDPGPSVQTGISIKPVGGGVKFVLPPGAQFPLVIAPGELKGLAESGIKDVWVNFILGR